MTLQHLGLEHHTDKADDNHSFNGKTYLETYSDYFELVRGSVHDILEIGVLRGESLRTWEAYFPNAVITGVDINPEARRVKHGDRVIISIGSQIDERTFDIVRHYDLIIDDGSHVVEHIVATFKMLWPRLRREGFYCIEDLGLSYADISESCQQWPGQKLNAPDTNYNNDRSKLNEVLFEMIKQMDHKHGDVQAIHFHSNLIIIQKI